jgi:hypothetical protein
MPTKHVLSLVLQTIQYTVYCTLCTVAVSHNCPPSRSKSLKKSLTCNIVDISAAIVVRMGQHQTHGNNFAKYSHPALIIPIALYNYITLYYNEVLIHYNVHNHYC